MKTWKKIVRLLVIVAVLIPTAALIAIQVPAVQTSLTHKVTERVTRGLEGDVTIGKVYYSFPNNLILKDILVVSEGDTLLSAGKMLVRVKATSLVSSDQVLVRRVSLEDGHAAIRRLDDSTTTLSKMLSPLKRANKDTTTALPWASVDLDRFTLKNFDFTYDDRLPQERGDTTVVPHINWQHIVLSDINLTARNIHYEDGLVSARINRLSFREQGGLDLQQLESDVTLDENGLTFDGLEYDDTWSQLHADRFRLGFSDFSDFENLLEKVSLDLSVLESRLDLRTIHYFTGVETLAKADLGLLLDGIVSGPFSDLRTDLLRIQSTTKETRLTLKGRIQGLSDLNTAHIGLQIFDGVTRTADIAGMLDHLGMGIDTRSIRKIAPGERISLKGSVNGRLSNLKAELDVKTPTMGTASIDGHLAKNGGQLQVEGEAATQGLDLGRILGQPQLGDVTARANLSFDNAGGHTRINLTPARIDRFHFRGYDYHDVVVEARMLDDGITADIRSDDPNLQLVAHGDIDLDKRTKNRRYRIGMVLDTVNLSALHFEKREGVTASLSLEADITQTPAGDFLGQADIRSLRAQVQGQTFDVGDIALSSTLDRDRYGLTLNSSVAKADYDGNIFISRFVQQAVHVLTEGHLHSLIRQDAPFDFDPEAFGSLMVRTLDLQPICSFLAPYLFVSRESSIGVTMLGNSVEGRIASELIASGSLFIHNLQGRIYNDGGLLRGDFDLDRVESGELYAETIAVDAAADNDGIDLRARFENRDEKKNRADLNARLSFGDPETDGWKLKADIRPSDLTLAGTTWSLDPATVYCKDRHFDIREFALRHDGQSLEVDGIAGEQPSDTLWVWLSDFDLNLLNAFLRDDFDIQGTMTGEGQGIAVLGQERGLLLNLDGDNMSMVGHPIGKLQLRSNWDDAEKAFKCVVNNTLEDRHPLRATAAYRPSDQHLDADLKLDRLSTGYLKLIFDGIFSDIDGSVSGRLKVAGPLDKLDIASENTRFNGLSFKLDYTQVDYYADGPFTVTSQGLFFNDITIKDKYGHPANFSGGVTYDHFKDLQLNLRFDLDNVLALNTKSTDNDSFYGKAYADGNILIRGPLDDIRLFLNLTSRENSNLHIPLDNSSSETTSLLTFINNEVKPLDLYDSLVLAHKVSRSGEPEKAASKLSVNLRLNTTPDIEVQLEVDRSTGDILKARGNGQINITAGGEEFDIKGNYRVDSGNYHFGMLGLTSRDFSINPGGTLSFNGPVMETDLDLTATYHTKASLSPILADSTAVSTRRNVECGIAITGKLANPQIAFKINIPDLDPSTASRVESAFNTEDKRMKQALALLISGGFVPDEQSGIVNSTTILFSNASELMAGQINNIFRQLDIPLDLGFNYQPTETGRSVFDVAVSTQLFNNRVSINGNIGNRQYISSGNSDIVGDLDIEIKLNRQGQLRMTLFSHSADQYSNYLDQSQRNGAGIVYQEDFNTFGELWRKLLHIKENESKTVSDTDAPGQPRTR